MSSRVVRFPRPWAVAALLALALGAAALPPRPASAQQPRLQGVVADGATGELIGSATVTLVASGIETRTSPQGTFAFPDAPMGRLWVRAQAPGYPAVLEEVEVTVGTIRFMEILLPRVDAVLDEILVVGAPSAPAGLPRTAADLLARKVLGTHSRTGILGRNDTPIILRGVNTFRLSSEPVIYLDGVRINGSFGRAMDVLSQISASDVREIRVVRGAAAAAVSGSATGVIYVETK